MYLPITRVTHISNKRIEDTTCADFIIFVMFPVRLLAGLSQTPEVSSLVALLENRFSTPY